eukprot:TRINITY_DN11331_c0_g1_i3.p1 TRINITY_DN11331_c0_g1~~TRINITY_DN11331_c0_g1_i3.p1  ORF type:complete len:162 (+),score=25.95 TRINITY_DN11331_c0_g1_i3:295-780(+)
MIQRATRYGVGRDMPAPSSKRRQRREMLDDAVTPFTIVNVNGIDVKVLPLVLAQDVLAIVLTQQNLELLFARPEKEALPFPLINSEKIHWSAHGLALWAWLFDAREGKWRRKFHRVSLHTLKGELQRDIDQAVEQMIEWLAAHHTEPSEHLSNSENSGDDA